MKFEYSKNIPFVSSLKPKQSDKEKLEKEKIEKELIDQLEIEIKPINGIAGSGFENQQKKTTNTKLKKLKKWNNEKSIFCNI